jgi:hypothetical protein
MGYSSSLIQRKFKDIVGKRYNSVLKEYSEFLLTEEEMIVPEVRSILMPLDIFVQEIPDGLLEILSAYDATVSLVYITDAKVMEILERTLNHASTEEFRRKKEEYGQKLLNTAIAKFEEHGLSTRTRIFVGHKGDDVIRMANDFDLVALSRRYGDGESTGRSVKTPAIIY